MPHGRLPLARGKGRKRSSASHRATSNQISSQSSRLLPGGNPKHGVMIHPWVRTSEGPRPREISRGESRVFRRGRPGGRACDLARWPECLMGSVALSACACAAQFTLHSLCLLVVVVAGCPTDPIHHRKRSMHALGSDPPSTKHANGNAAHPARW